MFDAAFLTPTHARKFGIQNSNGRGATEGRFLEERNNTATAYSITNGICQSFYSSHGLVASVGQSPSDCRRRRRSIDHRRDSIDPLSAERWWCSFRHGAIIMFRLRTICSLNGISARVHRSTMYPHRASPETHKLY